MKYTKQVSKQAYNIHEIFKKSVPIPYLHVQGYWSDGDTHV
jgi:hypothetical protein